MDKLLRPAAYSIAEAAAQLSVSRRHLYRLIDTGAIRRVKIGQRVVIPASEIDRLIADDSGEATNG